MVGQKRIRAAESAVHTPRKRRDPHTRLGTPEAPLALSALTGQMRVRYVALLRLLQQGRVRMTTREQNAHMDDLESLLLWLALSVAIHGCRGNDTQAAPGVPTLDSTRVLHMTYMGGWTAHLLLQPPPAAVGVGSPLGGVWARPVRKARFERRKK